MLSKVLQLCRGLRGLRKLTLYGLFLSLKAAGKGLNIYSVAPEQTCAVEQP